MYFFLTCCILVFTGIGKVTCSDNPLPVVIKQVYEKALLQNNSKYSLHQLSMKYHQVCVAYANAYNAISSRASIEYLLESSKAFFKTPLIAKVYETANQFEDMAGLDYKVATESAAFLLREQTMFLAKRAALMRLPKPAIKISITSQLPDIKTLGRLREPIALVYDTIGVAELLYHYLVQSLLKSPNLFESVCRHVTDSLALIGEFLCQGDKELQVVVDIYACFTIHAMEMSVRSNEDLLENYTGGRQKIDSCKDAVVIVLESPQYELPYISRNWSLKTLNAAFFVHFKNGNERFREWYCKMILGKTFGSVAKFPIPIASHRTVITRQRFPQWAAMLPSLFTSLTKEALLRLSPYHRLLLLHHSANLQEGIFVTIMAYVVVIMNGPKKYFEESYHFQSKVVTVLSNLSLACDKKSIVLRLNGGSLIRMTALLMEYLVAGGDKTYDYRFDRFEEKKGATILDFLEYILMTDIIARRDNKQFIAKMYGIFSQWRLITDQSKMSSIIECVQLPRRWPRITLNVHLKVLPAPFQAKLQACSQAGPVASKLALKLCKDYITYLTCEDDRADYYTQSLNGTFEALAEHVPITTDYQSLWNLHLKVYKRLHNATLTVTFECGYANVDYIHFFIDVVSNLAKFWLQDVKVCGVIEKICLQCGEVVMQAVQCFLEEFGTDQRYMEALLQSLDRFDSSFHRHVAAKYLGTLIGEQTGDQNQQNTDDASFRVKPIFTESTFVGFVNDSADRPFTVDQYPALLINLITNGKCFHRNHVEYIISSINSLRKSIQNCETVMDLQASLVTAPMSFCENEDLRDWLRSYIVTAHYGVFDKTLFSLWLPHVEKFSGFVLEHRKEGDTIVTQHLGKMEFVRDLAAVQDILPPTINFLFDRIRKRLSAVENVPLLAIKSKVRLQLFYSLLDLYTAVDRRSSNCGGKLELIACLSKETPSPSIHSKLFIGSLSVLTQWEWNRQVSLATTKTLRRYPHCNNESVESVTTQMTNELMFVRSRIGQQSKSYDILFQNFLATIKEIRKFYLQSDAMEQVISKRFLYILKAA